MKIFSNTLSQGKKMNIMLLEDELMLNESIEEYLKLLGHCVFSFTDGYVASNAIDSDMDLLIIDVNVPSMNGFELLENLKNRQIFIPTIFISAHIDIEDITRGYELGAKEYMKKPFHLGELGIKINQVTKTMTVAQNHILFSKNYSYCKAEKTLYFAGETQKLSKRQLDILHVLALNIGLIVDFERLRLDVWNGENIDVPTIRAEISRLKKSLKEDFIENARAIGYKIERYYPK